MMLLRLEKQEPTVVASNSPQVSYCTHWGKVSSRWPQEVDIFSLTLATVSHEIVVLE